MFGTKLFCKKYKKKVEESSDVATEFAALGYLALLYFFLALLKHPFALNFQFFFSGARGKCPTCTLLAMPLEETF